MSLPVVANISYYFNNMLLSNVSLSLICMESEFNTGCPYFTNNLYGRYINKCLTAVTDRSLDL